MSTFHNNLSYFLENGSIGHTYLDKVNTYLSSETDPTIEDLISFSDMLGLSVDILLRKDVSKLLHMVNTTDIKLLVVDVDGVMTDGGMYYTESGDEFKKFHTRDGVAIRRLTKSGFEVAIISSGFNKKLIQRRADLLGIKHVHVGDVPKIKTLEGILNKLNMDMQNVAYIGDDINDKEAIERVAFSACPADAEEPIKEIVDIVLRRKGGEGCIREFVDLFLSKNCV